MRYNFINTMERKHPYRFKLRDIATALGILSACPHKKAFYSSVREMCSGA